MSVALGMGDILMVRLLFDHNNMNVPIFINRWTIRRYRNNSKQYFDFISRLVFKLFPEHDIIFIDVPVTRTITTCVGYETYRFSRERLGEVLGFCHFLPLPRNMSLRKYFDVSPFLEEENYIVFLTKARMEQSRSLYLTEKQQLVSCVKELKTNYKIVILGERAFNSDAEISSGIIFCVYDLWLGWVENNDILDLSVHDLNHGGSKGIFERDIRILANAKHVFGIGYGGNFIMASLFCETYTFYIGALDHPYLRHIIALSDKNKSLYGSMKRFVEHLTSIAIDFV